MPSIATIAKRPAPEDDGIIIFRSSNVPNAARTFRVFVSSTFEDLKAERDALRRDEAAA